MLLPATTRLTKVALPVLEALVAVAWLNASAVTLPDVIKPTRILTDWTVELAWMSAVVAVWVLVTVSVTEPELANVPSCIEAPEALTVLFVMLHPRPTGKSGPTLATLEPAGDSSKPP